MSKKIHYYYDPEDCSFKEVRNSPLAFVRKFSSYLFFSCCFAAVGLYAYLYIFDDPKTAMLRNENKGLVGKIDENLVKISRLETALDQLHQRDNEFYRTLLNRDPIASGVWNGGVGGSADYQASTDPSNLQEAEKRIQLLEHKIQLQESSYNELFKEASKNQERLTHIPAIKPVPGKIVSTFGKRKHPIFKVVKMHYGLDFQARIGTPVYATGDGKVIKAGKSYGGYGYQIEIDHGFGFVTKYAHLKKDGIKVKKGQKVKRGDVIALTGNTGLSKGPHLHYEIIKDGNKKIDPIDYFYANMSPEQIVQLRREAEAVKDNESMD